MTAPSTALDKASENTPKRSSGSTQTSAEISAVRLASLESVFHSAPIGLCAIDLDFRYVTVNQCFAQLYGRDTKYFAGLTVEQALPEVAGQIMAHLRHALEADKIVEAEITVPAPVDSGKPDRIFLRTAQPVRDQQGVVFGLSVALIDMTARKQAEAALRESEENLRYTVELTPHIPWTALPNGEVNFMSPRWQEVTGARPAPALLRNWTLGVHPDDRERTLTAWQRSVETGDDFDGQYRVRCLGGMWRWHRARAYPRRSLTGEVVQWYGTVEDIHDRKIAEDALANKTMRLEQATEELNRLAQQDHLTGLANRRTFDEQLAAEIKRARRSDLPLALVILDVDHFKRLNDTYGHSVGDEVLRAVAHAIDGVIRRPGDLSARFGGEEFALVLPNTAEHGAWLIADRASTAVRSLHVDNVGHGSASQGEIPDRVTISAGVAMLDLSRHAGTEEELNTLSHDLLNAADKALYNAKATGRDRVILASTLQAAAEEE